MSILAEEEVVRIVRAAGAVNNLSVAEILTAPAFTYAPAIEIRVVLTPRCVCSAAARSKADKLAPARLG